MKKILILSLFLLSCETKTIRTSTNLNGGNVTKETGIFVFSYQLDEFDYKGHKYISCKVRDGISLTHAGHCYCNKIEK